MPEVASDTALAAVEMATPTAVTTDTDDEICFVVSTTLEVIFFRKGCCCSETIGGDVGVMPEGDSMGGCVTGEVGACCGGAEDRTGKGKRGDTNEEVIGVATDVDKGDVEVVGEVVVLEGGGATATGPPPPLAVDGLQLVLVLKSTVAHELVLEQLKLIQPIFSPQA